MNAKYTLEGSQLSHRAERTTLSGFLLTFRYIRPVNAQKNTRLVSISHHV